MEIIGKTCILTKSALRAQDFQIFKHWDFQEKRAPRAGCGGFQNTWTFGESALRAQDIRKKEEHKVPGMRIWGIRKRENIKCRKSVSGSEGKEEQGMFIFPTTLDPRSILRQGGS